MDTETPARPIVGHPEPVKFDLLDSGLVTHADLAQIIAVSARHGRTVTFGAEAPDSTLENGAGLSYRVTDGNVIARELPRVWNLYQAGIPQLARTALRLEIKPSRYDRSAITLNELSQQGARYENHVDSNSVTGLLFATTIQPEDGGELQLQYPGRPLLRIVPKAGTFLLYDARWVPHEVLPLKRDAIRLSLPMNYFLPTDVEIRPERLDDYIFGGA